MNASQSPSSSPWMDVRQAAAYIGVHPESIRRAIRKGQLRAPRVLNGRALRVHVEWLDSYVIAASTPVEVQR